jgi:hypothetical protein
MIYLLRQVAACSIIALGIAFYAPGLPGFHAAASQSNQVPRDWIKNPAVVELDTDEDVFALGDVHGDYGRLLKLLTAGQIIPQAPDHPHEAKWNARKALLVCTGDLIDKGDHSLKVIKFIRALAGAAAREGGRVIVTMGNHEAAFLTDPANDKSERFAKELKDAGIKPASVPAGRDAHGIGEFLHSLPLAARVNDWFFAHAGYTRGRTLKQLRSELQEGIDGHGYNVAMSASLDALLEARLHPLPWWEKEGDESTASRARLSSYVKALGVQHIVIGHQPGKVRFADQSTRKKGEIYQKFDGLIFLIDVGMSRGVDDSGEGYSHGALLRIRGGRHARATAIFPGAPARQLWPE